MWNSIDVIGAFLAGHAVVGGIVWLVYRMWRDEPDLTGRRQALVEVASRTKRQELLAEELERAQDEFRTVAARQVNVAEIVGARDLPIDTNDETIGFAALSLVFLELDAIVSYVLSGGSQLLGWSDTGWAFFSFPVSAATVLLWHVLMAATVQDLDRPARTIRRARRAVVLSGLLVVGALVMVLAGRNLSDEPELVATLTGIGLLALAATASICSAFCSILAVTYFAMQAPARQKMRLDARAARYGQHIRFLQRETARLAVTATGTVSALAAPPAVRPIEPPITPAYLQEGLQIADDTADTRAVGASPTHKVPLVVLVAAMLAPSFIGGAVRAQEVGSNTRAVSAFVRQGACELMIDASDSVDSFARQAAVTRLSSHLEIVTDALECRLLRLVSFSAEPVLSIDEYSLPRVTDPRRECQSVSPPAADALYRVYPVLAEKRRREAMARCLQEQKARAASVVSVKWWKSSDGLSSGVMM